MARINYQTENPEVLALMLSAEKYVRASGIDPHLLELLKIRASQINGCAFCLDMHTRDAIKLGEAPERLFVLSAWRETSAFTPIEQAVLRFTEAVTQITGGVSDEIFDEMRKHFSTSEIVNLIMAINTINAWNRIAITLKVEPAVAPPTK